MMSNNTKDYTNYILGHQSQAEIILSTRESALQYIEKHYPWKYDTLKNRLLDPSEIVAHGLELHPNEVWIILEEAPRYAVTNTGRCIISMVKKNKWKELKGTPASKGHGKGHLTVGIAFTPGNTRVRYIHQLVEKTFCRRLFDVDMYLKTALEKAERNRAKRRAAGKYKNEKLSYRNPFDVHHLDGNVRNNTAENLVLLPRAIHHKLELVEKYEVLIGKGFVKCQNLLELARIIGLHEDICSVAQPVADAYKTIAKAPVDVKTAIAEVNYCPVHYRYDENGIACSTVPMDMSTTDTPDKPYPGCYYRIQVTFRRDKQ